MDFQQGRKSNHSYNSFSLASMICGIVSILLCCTGVLSLPLGALGILFAILTFRKGEDMPPMSVAGLAASCIGLLLGVIMCVYAFYLILTNPTYRAIYEDPYRYYYEEFHNLENLNTDL